MTTDTIKQDLLELEKAYWRAIKDKNADAAMRLSDDPCIITGAQGVGRIDRQSLGGMLRSAPYTLHEFTIGDPQVSLL